MYLEENLYSLKLPEWQVRYTLTDPKNVKGFSLLNLAAFSSRLFVQKSLASQGCYSLCWKDRICCYTVRNGTWIIFYAVKGVFLFHQIPSANLLLESHNYSCPNAPVTLFCDPSDLQNPELWVRWACKTSHGKNEERRVYTPEGYPPPKLTVTNISPENCWIERLFSFWNGPFSGDIRSFSGRIHVARLLPVRSKLWTQLRQQL